MLDLLLKRPLLVVIGFAIAVSLFSLQSRHFEINASADTLISEGNVEYVESQQVNQEFAPEEFLIVAYRPHKTGIFSGQSLADIAEISRRIEEIPRVASVRSVLNVPLVSQARAPLGGQFEAQNLTQASLQLGADELSAVFRQHPIYEGLLVTPEQTATAIQVLFKSSAELAELERQMLAINVRRLQQQLTQSEKEQLKSLKLQAAPLEKQLRETRNDEVEQVRRIVADYEHRADLFLGGVHVLGYQLIKIVEQDLLVFGAAIAAVICVMVLVLFRSFSWLLITVICCSSSLLMTLGLFGMLGLKATVISSNFIALQLILSLAIVIHLIVQYREDARQQPDLSHRQLVLHSMHQKLAPCFFAGFTTSVGFASLLLSGIEPVTAFGWMMIVAMAVTIACTLLLFPALLLLFPRPGSLSPHSIFRKPVEFMQVLCVRRGGWIIACSALLLGISITGSLRLDVENSFINYFSENTRVHKELKFIDREFGGSTPLDVVYTPPQVQPGADDQLALRAVDVQNVHRIQNVLDDFSAMGTTLSVVNFTRLAKQINGNRPLTEYELTAVYWSLDRGIRENLVSSFFVESPKRLRISARIQDSYEGLDRARMLSDMNAKIQALGINPEQYQLTNLFVLYQTLLQQLFESQILTLGVVFIALGLAFWLIFRSLRVALVAMLPNIISAITVLGVMGWLGIPLDFMTITIAAVAMGIAVDDTIHYTHRYLQEAAKGEKLKALASSHRSVGYALVYTSSIIAIGFGLLGLSDFIPSVMFGLLTSMAIIIALFADLLLLPVLLVRFIPVAQQNSAEQQLSHE